MAREQPSDGQPDARAALERYQLHGVRETGVELGRGSRLTTKGCAVRPNPRYDVDGDKIILVWGDALL